MTRRVVERKKKSHVLQSEAHPTLLPPSSSSLEANANSGPSSSTISVEPKQHMNTSQAEFKMGDDLTSVQDELTFLSHAELISKLQEAQAKIKELEAMISCNATTPKPNDEQSVLQNEEGNSLTTTDTAVETNFPRAYDFGCAEGAGEYPIFDEQQELLVAFEYNGYFPNCDEDLSWEDHEPREEERSCPDKLNFGEVVWESDCDHDEDDSRLDDLPLIPSPVLNTPPYEYLFLTKENEAKLRIFLNPKLDRVFQEELSKLQRQEELRSTVASQEFYDPVTSGQHHGKIISQPTHLDLHNQNHLMNTSVSSGHDVKDSSSAANVIHCFDQSDVDLELKKMFMEKPPITHRIVRRKSRRERGSSVPGIDSYYGTKDLSKVGHASYFIPNLTESERKSIGWKPEYHYGHWKYAAFNVPNLITNPISLHPHPHPDEECEHCKNIFAHHQHHHTTALLSENPLHQKDINLSEPFVTTNNESQTQSEKVQQHAHRRHHPSCKYYHDEDSYEEGTLSFLTLSGSSQNVAPSCHIIPDKGTLRKILKWIMPSCVKPVMNSEISVTADGAITYKPKVLHEIETLVKPSSNMTFQPSHTQISFEAMGMKLPNHHEDQSNSSSKDHSEHQSGHHHHHHAEHHHHHHHHGFFHWKNILGTSWSNESMSAVGGDVVESCYNSAIAVDFSVCNVVDTIHVDPEEKISCHTDGTISLNVSQCEETSSTEDSGNEQCEGGNLDPPKRKLKTTKRLKPCKAFTRLLTLKDIGYELDKLDCELQEKNKRGGVGEGEARQMMKV